MVAVVVEFYYYYYYNDDDLLVMMMSITIENLFYMQVYIILLICMFTIYFIFI